MDTVFEQRVSDIVIEALAYADPGERDTYVARVCSADAKLLRAVKVLLDEDARSGGTHSDKPDAPGHVTPSTASIDAAMLPSTDAPHGRIGRYKLLEKLGEGGFGVVWLAEQREPLWRHVALKVIKLGMDTKQVIARFEAERQALALMDHPNIARVIDAGSTESSDELAGAQPTIAVGRPYFVMELVRGVPITKFCNDRQLDVDRRMELYTHVCSAVQHAHTKGIIHRDIKPSNVLVTSSDGADQTPVPKVIDFGIAKALHQPLTDEAIHTGADQRLGTPAYMSPEQKRRSPLGIDTRSDVYSLGVLLYELLTGQRPSDVSRENGDTSDPDHIEVPPLKPSVALARRRLSLAGTQRGNHGSGGLRSFLDRAWLISTSTASRIGRLVTRSSASPITRDIDTIVLKCLNREPDDRYQSAVELAEDLRRYLRNDPIIARPGIWYVLWRMIQRNRGRIAASLLLASALTWGIWQWQSAAEASRTAERRAWIATLRNQRGKALNHPGDEVRAALSGLWGGLCDKRCDPAETAELAAASVRLTLAQRRLTSLADLIKRDGRFLIGYQINVGWVPPGFALLISPELFLDGQPVASTPKPDAFIGIATYDTVAEVDDIDVGHHVLTGNVHVRFARRAGGDLATSDASESPLVPPDGCEVLESCELTVGPFRLTALSEYPPHYPAAVEEPVYRQRFEERLQLEHLGFVVLPRLGLPDVTYDLLRVALTFPAPPFDVACSIDLSVPDYLEIRREFAFRPSDSDGGPEFLGWRKMDRELQRIGDVWRLVFDIPTTELIVSADPQSLIGRAAELRVEPSLTVARSSPGVEAFIALRATRNGYITDSRSQAHREAAKILYPALNTLVLPDAVSQSFLADSSASQSVRAAAVEMLVPFCDDNVLYRQSWEVLRKPAPHPDDCQRALLRAREAAKRSPSPGTANLLGLALYRTGGFQEALSILTGESAAAGNDIGTNLAFTAMCQISLGQVEDARTTLARLQHWLDDNKVPREHVRAFHRVAQDLFDRAARSPVNPD
jgi:serine/threonine protein kinase